MSREIKFRTWDTQNKEFSEWTNRDPFFSTSEGKLFFWERVRKDDGTYGGDIILQDVGDRFVLQQYIGIKDKNGKDIYEGDLIEIGYGEHRGAVGKVIFEYGSFMLESKYNAIFQDTCKSILCGELIGNIFENTELFQ